jgi:hypothetical protein
MRLQAMLIRRTLIATLALGLLPGLVACSSSSKATVSVKGSTTISVGQELLDLKRALDEGAISQRDYDKVRAILLDRKS